MSVYIDTLTACYMEAHGTEPHEIMRIYRERDVWVRGQEHDYACAVRGGYRGTFAGWMHGKWLTQEAPCQPTN